jgi:uncharacterized Zn-finger protein
MQAIAEPIRILKNPVFPAHSKLVCRFYDTTAPTKEGLLWDDKIVSNLHEQMSGRGSRGALGINDTRQYGARHFNLPRLVDFRPSPLPSKVHTMSDHAVPHFHNDAGVSVIEIGSQEFMCVGANPPFDHPHVFLDLGNDNEIICPYCSTLYRYAADLAAGEARPPECVVKDKVA